jgi:peptidoglycan/xylan/chitin deacetylase (PgdA/CDA1 family)
MALSVAGCAVYWTEPLAAIAGLEALTPNVVYRVETGRPLVGLSFDDGPHPVHTPQVLDILARRRARATFFLIGERARRHPALVERIRAEGHEIGNHCDRDATLLLDSDAEFVDNLERTGRLLGLTGLPKLFRPPGGLAWPRQLELARARGYVCVLGSAYPHDPARPPVWYIRWLTAKNLAPGAIVILHDGIPDASRGIAALPAILAAGRDRGLEFVSVGALLEASTRRGTPEAPGPDPDGRRRP